MEFWSLIIMASMPVLQVLLVGLLGAFLSSKYMDILSSSARRDMNKIVYFVFAPALVFANLARTVTLEDIISWWFMPVNIGITFLIGGIFGWIAAKILRPLHHLEGLVIASCSAGNLGNLLLMIIPAICNQKDSPFGDPSICNAHGLSYVSLSMSLGGVFIWTVAYSLMKRSADLLEKIRADGGSAKITCKNVEESAGANLFCVQNIIDYNDQEALLLPKPELTENIADHQGLMPLSSRKEVPGKQLDLWCKLKSSLHQIMEELLSPPTISSIVGLSVGVAPWLKSLIIGAAAPLRVVQDCMILLGDGTLPCITLILGGNLTQGLCKSELKPLVIIAIIGVRYVILPLCGIMVIKAAGELGFLPYSPLYHYVLLIQYTLPPAMSIGTMSQLFDVGQEECSVIFMWTYLVAAVALTVWSMVFIWILS